MLQQATFSILSPELFRHKSALVETRGDQTESSKRLFNGAKKKMSGTFIQRMHFLQQAVHTIFLEDVLQGDSRTNQVLPDP
jgi:hypothetical protein